MGLDFNASDAHWSYSGFHRFRKEIAKTVDINLEEMIGYAEVYLFGVGTGNNGKLFPDKKEQPLVILLDHSDCEGEISAEDCALLADPPEIAIKEAFKEDEYDYKQGMLLVEGLREMAKEGTPLEFQ